MKKPLVVAAQERSAPLDVGGFLITVLASSELTGGYELFHMEGAEGQGPGPHHHPWDESFYVLSGEVHLGVDGVDTRAKAGALVHVPAGATHWFRFGASGGKMFTITSKGKASKMFEAFSGDINWQDPDRRELAELGARYGQVVIQ
jgi:quercetin dioxygenase-like cupin family protein